MPASLGWLLLAYGVVVGILLSASPIWAIAVAGILVVLGDQRRRAIATEGAEPSKGHPDAAI